MADLFKGSRTCSLYGSGIYCHIDNDYSFVRSIFRKGHHQQFPEADGLYGRRIYALPGIWLYNPLPCSDY